MADYVSTTVGKPFRVKDPVKFERLLKEHGIEPSSRNPYRLCYIRENDEFSIYGYETLTVNDPTDDDPIFLPDLIQPHLADGSVAVFKQVGHTKCRFDETGGMAVVVSDKWVLTFSLDTWIEGIVKNLIDEHGRGR